MKTEAKTSFSNKNMPYNQNVLPDHHTPVSHKYGSDSMNLVGSSAIRVSAHRHTSGGLIVFNCNSVSQLRTQLPAALRTLSMKPYAQTLEALRQHQALLRKKERDPSLQLNIAWISPAQSSSQLNCRALESFELSLAHTLFLESTQAEQSVEAVCSEGHFDAIVFEGRSTPSLLKRAHKWLRPAQHNPLVPEPANVLAQHPRERVFVLINDFGTRA